MYDVCIMKSLSSTLETEATDKPKTSEEAPDGNQYFFGINQ